MSAPTGPAEMAEAARVAAGVLAARAREDDDAVRLLLSHVPDPDARAVGFLMVAELTATLLAEALECSREDVCARLSVAMAAGLATR